MKMRLSLTTLFVGIASLLFSQSWIDEYPISVKNNKGPYQYWVGEGNSYEEAIIEAIKIIASQGGVSAEVIREREKEISSLARSSRVKESATIDFGEKSFDVELVEQAKDKGQSYVLYAMKTKFHRPNDSPGRLSPGKFVLRSLVVPSWGQFYNNETSKGLLFSLGEVALIGGIVYSFGQAANQKDKADLALLTGNIGQFNDFDTRKNNWKTTGLILGASAAAVWILNVIDASASTKNRYAKMRTKKGIHLLAQNDQFGLKYSF